jgi:8-oxo-dGTP pyrophosphatase MutT (NUDIX family)
VTASAWLIDATCRRVLLTHHRKLGMWLQLGGHADGESDLLAAAIREAKEESGLADIQAVTSKVFDVDVHAIPPHGSDPAHDHYDVRFLLRSDGPGKCRVSDESIDLRWFTAEELRELPVDNSVRRMARRWKNWLALRNELPPEDGRFDGSIHRIGSQNG